MPETPAARVLVFGLAILLAASARAGSVAAVSDAPVSAIPVSDAPVSVTPLSVTSPPVADAAPVLAYAPDFLPRDWPWIDTSVELEDLPEEEEQLPEQQPEGYMDRSVNYLLHQRKSISTRVNVMARAIDRYLAGDRAMAEDNESFMKLQLAERWIEGGKWDPDNDLKFRLDLPATKRRYRLVLTYRPDFDSKSLAEQTLPTSQVQSVDEEKSLFAGAVRTMKNEADNWEGRLQGGVKVRWPLDPFVRFNTRREVPLGANWNMIMRNGAAWFAEDGFSAKNSLAFDHVLGPQLLFRATSSLQWREEEDTLEMAQVFDLYHTLDQRRLLDYQVGVLGTSWSNPQVNVYYVSLIYRQELYRDWLYLNVVPQIAYPREDEFGGNDDFDDVLSLLVGIELFFNQF